MGRSEKVTFKGSQVGNRCRVRVQVASAVASSRDRIETRTTTAAAAAITFDDDGLSVFAPKERMSVKRWRASACPRSRPAAALAAAPRLPPFGVLASPC